MRRPAWWGRGVPRTADVWLVTVGSALAALQGLNDRVILYHDEVINTYNAAEGIISSSTRRPLYYALNWLATRFFGLDVESLVLLSVGLFVATALVVFLAVRRVGGRPAAALAVGAFVGSAMVVEHGVRGMPHVSSAFFAALTAALVLTGEVAPSRRARGWLYGAAGAAAILALATHTTMLAVCAGLGLWVVGRELIPEAGAPPRPWMRRERWAALAGLAGTGLVAFVLFEATSPDASYFGALAEATERVQTTSSEIWYVQPWWYYPAAFVADRTLPILGAWALLLTGGAWLTARRAPQSEPRRSEPAPGASPVWASLVLLGGALVVLSVISWKFERVAVGVVPLVALAIGTVSGRALGRWRGERSRRAVALLSLLLVVGCVVWTGWDLRQSWQDTAFRKRHLYTTFYEVLEHLPDDPKIVHLGGDEHRFRMERYVLAAGREWEDWGPPVLEARELEARLLDEEVRFLLTQPRDGEARWLPGPDEVRLLRFEHLYDYRGYADLWRVEPAELTELRDETFGVAYEELLGAEIREVLETLPAREVVAVFRPPADSLEVASFFLQRELSAMNLRPYEIPLDTREVRQFHFLDRNSIDYILLFSGAGLESLDPEAAPKLVALGQIRRRIGERGGRRMATSDQGFVELWTVPHPAGESGAAGK